MKHHVLYAILAVITFIGHMLAMHLVETELWLQENTWVWFLPEYIWIVSLILSVLAIYGGIVTATKIDPDKRGTAIASAVIGGVVLLILLGSGSNWLFMPVDGYEMMISIM